MGNAPDPEGSLLDFVRHRATRQELRRSLNLGFARRFAEYKRSHLLLDDVEALDGLPHVWIARMKRSIRTLGWRFNAERMVKDYVVNCYLPAAGGVSSDMGRE